MYFIYRLYKSPKKLTSEEKSESTEKWLEKNIDDMDDVELKETRTALLSKLNQLKLLSKFCYVLLSYTIVKT